MYHIDYIILSYTWEVEHNWVFYFPEIYKLFLVFFFNLKDEKAKDCAINLKILSGKFTGLEHQTLSIIKIKFSSSAIAIIISLLSFKADNSIFIILLIIHPLFMNIFILQYLIIIIASPPLEFYTNFLLDLIITFPNFFHRVYYYYTSSNER